MKKALISTTVTVMALGSAMVFAQNQAPQAHKGTAENRLVGISLYDTGSKVVSTYGSPDDILALNANGSAVAGGGGGGAPASGQGSRGGGSGNAAAGTDVSIGGEDSNLALIGDPFGANTEWLRQRRTPTGSDNAGGNGGGGGDSTGGRGGAPGAGDGGRAGGGATGGGNSGRVIFTRWVYKRSGSQYAFVLDKFNRVIQIEAIGMKNSNVKTRRGITFGSSFSSLIKAYNAPDSYEVSGDNLVVRFLVRDRVAFRLNRLYKDKPQVVTGIVVAAGKT